jgi:hypothetical protein
MNGGAVWYTQLILLGVWGKKFAFDAVVDLTADIAFPFAATVDSWKRQLLLQHVCISS